LAEKKAPEDVDVRATALGGIIEELNLPSSYPLDEVVRFMPEVYCCLAENLESSSYPGLPCVYVTHYCGVQLLDGGLDNFCKLGFLEDEFETKESDDKVNLWQWRDLEDARQNKVKGFPDFKQSEPKDHEQQATYEPILRLPGDVAGLRVLLEVGGVQVHAWGEFTAASLESLSRELHLGASHLEREVASGKIRRVLKSSLVQMMVQSGVSNSGSEQQLRGDNKSQSTSSRWDMSEAKGLVRYRADLDCFEVMHVDVSSYPGLPVCTQTRLVQFDQGSPDNRTVLTHRDHGTKDAQDTDLMQSTSSGAVGEALVNGIRRAQRNMTESSMGSSASRSSCASFVSSDGVGRTVAPRTSTGSMVSLLDMGRSSLFSQLVGLQANLRFKMVADEKLEAAPPPADQAVACACDILLIRNINPSMRPFNVDSVCILSG